MDAKDRFNMKNEIDQLIKLLLIPGLSTEENAVATYIEQELRSFGVPNEAIRHDHAQDQSEYGGNVGNLVVRFPRKGGHGGCSHLFMAHMDTVPLCRGAEPVWRPADKDGPERIVNANPNAALGGDCRAGVAVLLHLARVLMAAPEHPPVWLVFVVQEEVGLIGARGLELALLTPEPPVMAFNTDGSAADQIVSVVTGATRFFMEIHGRAAHSGINPERGVSAVVVASLALAELVRGGWHGAIKRAEGEGSANIGIIQGGEMTNTVMDKLIVRGEARSHDPVFREMIVKQYRAAYEKAAAETRSVDGTCARVDWMLGPCYDAFALSREAPVVRTVLAAMQKLNIRPVFDEHNNGGSDANWINAHGLPMVVLGSGMRAVHTVNEWINLDDFRTGCRLAELIVVE